MSVESFKKDIENWCCEEIITLKNANKIHKRNEVERTRLLNLIKKHLE